MSIADAYTEAAGAYADGVRVLFGPSGSPAGERGGRGPASFDALVEQAEQLIHHSEELTTVAAAQLSESGRATLSHMETKLLAKTLTDLEVSAYLLQGAIDEEEGINWRVDSPEERSAGHHGSVEESLVHLLDEARPAVRGRQGSPPANIKSARTELSNSIGDALDLIPERAGTTGQAALGGLIGLGVGELARVTTVVGMDLAEILGQAEKVTRLYDLFRGFLTQAFDNLIALLGKTVAENAAEQVVEWVLGAKAGELIGGVIVRLYEVDQIGQELKPLVTESQAEMELFVAAIEDIDGLEADYGEQIRLVEKLLRALRYLGGIPSAALPQGRLVLAAMYVLLGGYVVLAGADYLDTRRLQVWDRVRGVRQVVETSLA